jgi:16S rRNA (uracil1498-N3)-methyltransferase
MDRFFFPDLANVRPGAEARLSGAEAHHLAHVKRIGRGERVALFDGRGREVAAEVVEVLRGEVRLAVVGAAAGAPRALATRIALGIAPPKGKRAQVLVEKATELGAAAIFPIATARTVAAAGPPEKWRRWAVEAAKQAGGARLPEIGAGRPFAAALGEPAALRLILDPREGARPLRELLGAPREDVLVLVGPEGGFTDDEVRAAREAGFEAARLGPTVLRVETAAIAAIAAIAVALG